MLKVKHQGRWSLFLCEVGGEVLSGVGGSRGLGEILSQGCVCWGRGQELLICVSVTRAESQVMSPQWKREFSEGTWIVSELNA